LTDLILADFVKVKGQIINCTFSKFTATIYYVR